jgi:hypothetical protein
MEVPWMYSLPAIGVDVPVSMAMVVDFPAPLEPRSPKTSTALTWKSRPMTQRHLLRLCAYFPFGLD